MNEALINPFFTISHPTAIQTSLFAGASLAKFNPTGRFVAAARPTGAVEIWDLETRAPIRSLDGHVKSITSIDWSRNSRYVLSSSKDWNVLIWDLASTCDPPQRHASIRFDNPVVSANFHPKNSRILLVVLSTGEAYICDLRKRHRSRVELLETLPDEASSDEENQLIRSPMKTARFDPSGKNIIAGTASGNLLVFNARTKMMVARHRVSGAGSVKGLDFTKSGRRLVTNSTDRTLRQFILSNYPSPGPNYTSTSTSTSDQSQQPPFPFIDNELEPTHRFNDPINRTAWHAMSYSPDGDWLAGGAADQAAHKIYIWDLSNDGQFASALDGGREPLIDMHWHPTTSSLLSVTKQGNILVWHCPHPERWGAFAGGFEEVDENVDYEEREDEFDIEDEAVIHERKMKAEEEEVDIDSVTTLASSERGPGTTSAGGRHSNLSATGTGSATPVLTGTQSGTGIGNGHTPMAVDGAIGKLGPPSTGVYAAMVGVDCDIDSAWAEEEPDGDEPRDWKMKVAMEHEEGPGYY